LVIQQFLRNYVVVNQQDWVDHLELAKFCYNNSEHSAIRSTPFLSQPYFEESVRMRLTLLEWELGSPSVPPKLQSSISGVETRWIMVCFTLLKSYQNVNVKNELA
jgi:hypothetical protein